jgi:quercetin dioxygenase-like cupin family protein
MSDPMLPGGLQPLALGAGATPNAGAVAAHLRAEGVEPSSWSNGPGDRYAAHSHAYTKLLMCAAGSITFLVGEAEEPVELHPGEGFVLPPGKLHGALVGPDGCTCVEGHR